MIKPPTILRQPIQRRHAEALLRLAMVLVATIVTTALLPARSMASSGSTSLPVIVADFNHDGLPDALVPSPANATATLAFGAFPYGSFAAAKAVTFPAACTSFVADTGNAGGLVAGDFNGDGFADIIFTCTTDPQGDSLTGVMLGLGDGTFAPAVTLTTAYADGSVLGDFNHDGKLDAVVIAYPNGISLTNNQQPAILFFAGKGDGTFAAAVSSPLGSTATFQTGSFILGSPVAADLNADGYPDIVLNAAYGYTAGRTAGATLTISVFGNRKDGTFGATVQGLRVPDATAPVGTYPASNDLKVIAGSFSAPGTTDFIVPDSGSAPGLFLVKNTSTASAYSFATPVKTPYANLTAAAAGSFTGSGVTDLVVANGTNLVVLANDGAGTFAASYATLSVAATSPLFAVADANFDGYSDLYTATQTAALGITVNLVNGSATATSRPVSLSVGSQAIAASWPGSVLFSGSTAAGTQVVNGALSATAIASSKNPATLGDSVTLTAAVTPVAAIPTLPTGSVVFTDGTTPLATVPLDGTGRAAYTTSTLTAATHSIVASYTGDGFYASSLSGVLSQVVNRPPQAPPVLTWAAPASITFGTPLSATQLNAAATNAMGAPVAGTYAYTPAAGTILNAGLQTLSVTFTPTDLTNYTTVSATVPLTVLSVSSTTALSITSGGAAVSTVSGGSVVTLTATVASGSTNVTVGQVKFCDASSSSCADIHLLGLAQVTSAGTAVLRFIPSPGAHSYKALFVGTGNDASSASSAASLSVTAVFPTTTTIAQSGTTGNYTLTATVAGAGSSTPPTGSIAFLDTSNANASLGSAPLANASVALSQTTSATPSSGIEPESTAMADFNNDGIPDMVILNPTTYHGVAGSGTLTLLLGKGDGTFTAGNSPVVPDADAALGVGDFNGDGNADIAVLNDSGVVTILLGDGQGRFTTAAASPTLSGIPGSLVVADFNGDGKADLAISNYVTGGTTGMTTILLGQGDGTFLLGPATTSVTASFVQSVGDFNQDGKLDLVAIAGDGNTVTVLLGKGDGTFSVGSTLPSSVGYFAFGGASVADFNGDGKLDFVLGNITDGGPLGFTLYAGNGDGTFAIGPTTATPDTVSYAYSMQVGDFNGDGKPDLAVPDLSAVRILLNNGDGSFTQAASSPIPNTGGPDYLLSVVADFNGDGIPDIAVANSDLNTVTVLLTKRIATVTAVATGITPVGSGPHAVIASYPGDAAYAASVSDPTGLTGQSFTPTLAWTPAVPSIPYGTPLGPQQLNATVAGVNGVAVPGTFTYTPAAGTVLQAGAQTLRVLFTPTGNTYVPVAGTATITVIQAQPKIAWSTPAPIAFGTPLSASQLNATVTGVGGTTLPGVLTYAPTAGTVLTPGTQTLAVTFAPTDAIDYATATASVPVTVTGLTLASITPNTARLGDSATTITLTGSGFVTNSVARVNGTAIATTYVSSTTLTAVIPVASFAVVGTLQITVADPSISAVSAAQPLTVIPANPSVTLSGPSVTPPGSQPSLSFAITNPYPLPLTATFTLSFASVGSNSVDDPAIQFAGGGRSLSFVIPANSTAVPPIQLQAGTDAGTITIPLLLTANGVNVTPSGLAPVVIVVPASVPTLSTTTLTRSANTISVAIHGFSNTREVTTATFHFVAAPGATISTPDITAPVGTVFGNWFGSTASVPFGSTFTYTQVFTVSDDPKNIGSVQVTLTNGVGNSAIAGAQ